MTARVGEFKNGELWLRCPYCGDSEKNRWKAHYSVSPNGLYHCMRCGIGGKLSAKAWLSLYHNMPDTVDVRHSSNWKELVASLDPGPGNDRASGLQRFHLRTKNGVYDVFLHRNWKTKKAVGVQLINVMTKKKRNEGRRAFGIPHRLEVNKIMRIVEGPYDVLYENDICTYGIPSSNQMMQMKGWPVLLCPDGDVFEKLDLLNRLRNVIRETQSRVFYTGVERIPDGLDPDEVPKEGREMLTVGEFLEWRL